MQALSEKLRRRKPSTAGGHQAGSSQRTHVIELQPLLGRDRLSTDGTNTEQTIASSSQPTPSVIVHSAVQPKPSAVQPKPPFKMNDLIIKDLGTLKKLQIFNQENNKNFSYGVPDKETLLANDILNKNVMCKIDTVLTAKNDAAKNTAMADLRGYLTYKFTPQQVSDLLTHANELQSVDLPNFPKDIQAMILQKLPVDKAFELFIETKKIRAAVFDGDKHTKATQAFYGMVANGDNYPKIEKMIYATHPQYENRVELSANTMKIIFDRLNNCADTDTQKFQHIKNALIDTLPQTEFNQERINILISKSTPYTVMKMMDRTDVTLNDEHINSAINYENQYIDYALIQSGRSLTEQHHIQLLNSPLKNVANVLIDSNHFIARYIINCDILSDVAKAKIARFSKDLNLSKEEATEQFPLVLKPYVAPKPQTSYPKERLVTLYDNGGNNTKIVLIEREMAPNSRLIASLYNDDDVVKQKILENRSLSDQNLVNIILGINEHGNQNNNLSSLKEYKKNNSEQWNRIWGSNSILFRRDSSFINR